MLEEQLRRLGLLLTMLALQVLVFGHIHLAGYATPMVYVLFAASLRRGTGRVEAMLWCFAMGLSVDVFTLTPGLAAASMTLLGLVQPRLFNMMLAKDALENCAPSYSVLSGWRYVCYVAILVVLHHLLFFSIEAFTLSHWHDTLLRMAGSVAITLVVVLPMQKIREL